MTAEIILVILQACSMYEATPKSAERCRAELLSCTHNHAKRYTDKSLAESLGRCMVARGSGPEQTEKVRGGPVEVIDWCGV